jgi:hypothetical protein
MIQTSNHAPAPNRRPRFPLGVLSEFEYLFYAPPSFPAAAGEAQRWLGRPEESPTNHTNKHES